MDKIKRELQKKQQEVQRFGDQLLARAALHDYHPEFPKADACRNAAIFLEVAWHNIFMAIQALEGIRDG